MPSSSGRIPLSTVSLTPFLPLDLPSRSHSPRKSSHRPMASPLRSSTSTSRSTTPQRSTTTTANGPLSTLYEAPIPALQPSPRPSPARQMLDLDRAQIGPDDDEEAAVDATPPRRLLDLFLQSATKNNGSSNTSPSARASPVPPAIRPPPSDKDDLPTWSFYEDPTESDASLLPLDASTTSSLSSTQEDTEMHSLDSPPPTNENAPPPPLPRRSRSTSSLAPPAATNGAGSALSASPRSRSTSTAPPPPPITLPSQPQSQPPADSPPTTPTSPPLFPSLWTETTSATGGGGPFSPSLNSGSQSFFGDTGTSSFEVDGQTRASSLLPGFVAAFSSPRRGGGKRESLEGAGEGEEGHEQKRLRMSVEGE
ncbi:hypothetical protein BCR35DRAFT_299765 [Leucosporidium creatinivorum]|uniref:Uncharacterized protein n=1 Tax=Leucosporidium creatinivorum TaxID=106004 RepID=A0A1Y2G0N1_9BASI|nr:hypothetical protein BCR35DRAFT_299765 [Leucosporidium creatinivorum]